MKKWNIRIGILMMGLSLFALVSCKKDTPGANEVFMDNSAFSPSSKTISAGTTITWTNKESSTHTVTSDNALFESGDMAKGKTFSFTFSNTGTFKYHCKYHAGMTAEIIVK
jgi:plastocyanin